MHNERRVAASARTISAQLKLVDEQVGRSKTEKLLEEAGLVREAGLAEDVKQAV